MCSASCLMVFNICMKFHENMSSSFKLMEQTQNNTQRAITPKVGEPELWFMCSAHCLMVFIICVKFQESMSSSFKLMQWE